MGKGLASTLASFLALTAVMCVVHLVADSLTFVVGCSIVGAFLAVWGMESIRGWRAAQGAVPAGGKDEQ